MNNFNFPSLVNNSRFHLIALLLCVAISGLEAETAPSNELIPKNRQVILSSSVYNRPTWTPSEEQTELALAAIYKYLDAGLEEPTASIRYSDAKKIRYIKKHFGEFAVQFQGIGYNDSRRIWCNFFPVEEHPKWEEETVFRPKENELLYWDIVFRPNENACRDFNYVWVKLE